MPGPAGLSLIQGAIADIIAVGGHLNGAVVRLYMNNHIPTRSDNVGNYVEAAWGGYHYQTPAWTPAALTGLDQPGFTSSGVMTFGPNTSGVAQSVFGYYVTEPGGAPVLFKGAELFVGGPIVIPNGLAFQLTVVFQDISQF
jgi:hypothetical protein